MLSMSKNIQTFGSYFFFFGDEDKELVKEIAKVHKLPVEKVEEAYKEMLDKLEDEKED